MLDRIRRGQRWMTVIFIAVIGGVFVFFMGSGGPMQGGPTGSGADTVVALGDIQYTLRDFQRIQEQQLTRLQDAIGSGLDSRTAEQFASQQALRSLLESAVLAHSARELGLAVGKKEIQRALLQDPSLRGPDGRLDRENFRDQVEYNFGSQRLFLEVMRLDLLRQKMLQVLYQQAHVSDDEARFIVRQRSEEIELTMVSLDTRKLPPGDALSEVEIAVFAEESGQHLRALYDESTAFLLPEQVRVRHLLITVEPGADDASLRAARDAATSARERIAAGETFAEVARELSQDEGSRESGGDLGWIARGETTPELEAAAFGLDVGALSEIVESDAGFHLVLLEDKRAAGKRPFEEVSDELARGEAEAARASERANRLADELGQAVRNQITLEDAARERGLTLIRPAPLRRRPDGMIDQVGASRDLMAAAFAAEPGTSSPRVFSVDSKLILFQVMDRETPNEEEIEALVASTREQLLNSRRNELVRVWIDREESALNDAGLLHINAELATGG